MDLGLPHRHHLTRTNFASLAQFERPIDLNLPLGDECFGQTATGCQTSGFELGVERDAFTAKKEIDGRHGVQWCLQSGHSLDEVWRYPRIFLRPAR